MVAPSSLLLALVAQAATAAAHAAPSVSFAAPSLVGYSNSSLPGGSNFWFPSITIPTGIKGHVAQHITLSGDGGACPPKPPLSQFCEQIMLSTDGGRFSGRNRSGVQGSLLNPLGLFLRTAIPVIRRILSAILPA